MVTLSTQLKSSHTWAVYSRVRATPDRNISGALDSQVHVLISNSSAACHRVSANVSDVRWCSNQLQGMGHFEVKFGDEGVDWCKPNFNAMWERHFAVVCKRTPYSSPFVCMPITSGLVGVTSRNFTWREAGAVMWAQLCKGAPNTIWADKKVKNWRDFDNF